jgi:hypothetical protein
VGVAARDRIEVAGRTIRRDVLEEAIWARLVLQNPQVGAAIVETGFETVRRRGLPIDGCDVAVLMPADDMERRPTEVERKVAMLLRATARKVLILNSKDPRGPALLPLPGRLIWIVDDLDASDFDQRRSGDLAVTLKMLDDHLFLCILDGRTIRKLAKATPNLTGPDGLHVRRAVLCAIGLAHGLGLPLGDIAAYLRESAGADSMLQ